MAVRNILRLVAAEDVIIGLFAVPWDGDLYHVPC